MASKGFTVSNVSLRLPVDTACRWTGYRFIFGKSEHKEKAVPFMRTAFFTICIRLRCVSLWFFLFFLFFLAFRRGLLGSFSFSLPLSLPFSLPPSEPSGRGRLFRLGRFHLFRLCFRQFRRPLLDLGNGLQPELRGHDVCPQVLDERILLDPGGSVFLSARRDRRFASLRSYCSFRPSCVFFSFDAIFPSLSVLLVLARQPTDAEEPSLPFRSDERFKYSLSGIAPNSHHISKAPRTCLRKAAQATLNMRI